MMTPREAPRGDISTFERGAFTHAGTTHPVYRKGSGPAVLILAEIPGLTPHVLGFADRVAALGCSVVLPQLFGTAGRDGYAGNPLASGLYLLSTAARACISREFSVLASGRSSPVVAFLRALAAEEHERCKGPGVGVVGMCFTGGFALAMAVDARVLAPVLAEPSLPIPLGAQRRRSIDCEPAALERVASRCANEGLRVLGLRFHGDPLSPSARFDFLRERLGDGFVAVELAQADRHPNAPLRKAHSVLTGDLIDEPGQPTRAALDQVLELLRNKLLQT
jgi:dienelactone hydrolase